MWTVDLARLLVGVLATWRVTYLLHAEDGPWDAARRLRAATGWRALDCFYCLSLWVAVPFAWLCGAGWLETLLLWPGLSGGAILLERAVGGPLPRYTEDPET